MEFKKILFPTKFRELAFNSLESILELKKAGLKEVVLTYIIPRDEVAFVPYGGYMKDEEERLREQARIRFENWQEAISAEGIESKIRIEVGNPVPKLLRIAEEEKVDLIIAGRKKRTVLGKVYVGSHTLELIRRSTVPVLVSKYMVRFEWEGDLITRVNDRLFTAPLLATDWSEPSEKALGLVSSFKELADKVMVTHIIGVKISKGLDKSELNRIEKESKERLEEYCDRLKKDGINAEPHLFSGRSAHEIVRVAREHKASMIVMGTTGKDRFKEFWLGSVSHRVTESSELPVLLVP
ncbi:MAG: universal stress protein [Deltaproteobacteria bacterium]|jgi:nucleotide-binding universal stress UspA family protein|nr:universal stress protein [Deltaproteobacteria bacterium]MDL2123601.1 universal stress protein [Deltaproteobacteria bacterium]